MQIKSVTLINFKKHVNLHCDFTQGLTTIQGDNYSGKTTVTQAVLWALFGPSAVLGSAKDMVNSEVGGQAEVKLALTDGYEIHRKGNNVTLSKDGDAISRSASVVGKEIEKLFGLTKEEFLMTRVAVQGSSQDLLAVGTEKIKKVVEKLSGVETLDQISSQVKSEVVRLGAVKEVLEGSALSKEEYEYNAQVIELSTTQLPHFEELNEVYLKSKSELSLAVSGLTERLAESARITKENSDARARIVLLESEIANYEEGIDGMLTEGAYTTESALLEEEVQFSTKTLDKVDDLYLASRDNERTVADLLERLEGKRSGMEVSIHKAEQAGIREDLKTVAFGDLNEFISDKKAALKEVNYKIKNNACPTCERAFKDVAPIEELEREKEELTSSLNGVVLDLASAKEWAELQAKIETCKVSVEKLEEKLTLTREREFEPAEDLKVKRKVLVKELEECKQALVKSKTNIKLLTTTTRSLIAAKEALTDTSLRDLEEPEDAEPLAEELQLKQFKLSECSTELTSLVADLAAYRAEVAQAQALLDKNQELSAKLKKSSADLKAHNTVAKVIKEHRGLVLENVWKGLLNHTESFVRTCTGEDINQVRMQDGKITYSEGENVYNVTQASGAQKTLISVGLKVALCSLLPSNVKFLLVDEISADMDDTVAATAMATLVQRVPQIVSVSHRDLDSVVSENVVSL